MMDGQVMPDVDRSSPRIFAGRYQVERMIARGGMGEVYLCTDLDLRRPVALKILRAGVDTDDGGRFIERFRLEARTLATLNHTNIVTLYEYGETDDGQLFLALEYIDGPRFTDIARQGPMDPGRVLRLTMQVCRALRFAHRRGVVHRDLKPSNLLIRVDEDGEEQVKVVDFGLVKVVEDDQSLTRAGLILGSPHCMAPEQIRGLKGVDHRADIYAVGVLMFRALVGKWPFHGETSTATMIAHINQPTPSFAELNPDIALPPGLEDIVRRCLEKDPNNRYSEVAALMADLRELTGQPVTVTHSSLTLSGGSTESSIITSHASVPDSLPTGQQSQSAATLGPQARWSGMGVGLSLLLMMMVVGAFVLAQLSESGTSSVALQNDETIRPVDAPEPHGNGMNATPVDATPEADAPPADAGEDAPPVDNPTAEKPVEPKSGSATPPKSATPAPPPKKAEPKKSPPAASTPKPSSSGTKSSTKEPEAPAPKPAESTERSASPPSDSPSTEPDPRSVPDVDDIF